MQWFHIKKRVRGFLEIDVLLAIAVFSIIITAVLGSLVYAQQSIFMSGQRERAVFLADEGIEAVRNIRDNAFNELVLLQSGVDSSSGNWVFAGEGTDETLGIFTRTITISDICRDASNVIATCPAIYNDEQSKQITVTLTWTSIIGVSQTITRDKILTNWNSQDWLQTNWSGGSGQSTWSDITMYDSDDGNVDVSTVGEVRLASSGLCSPGEWPFTTAGNYTYNATDIEVTGGMAQLLSGSSAPSSFQTPVLDSYAFDTSYTVTPSFIPVSGEIYAVAYTGSGNDGFVKTVTIDSAGLVSGTIDTYEFDTSNGDEPYITNIGGDIYAIVYRGPGSDGYIKTLSIDAGGTIGTTIDTLEFDTSSGYEPEIIHVSGDVYAIVYTGPSTDGFVKTVSIDASGNVSGVIDTLEYNTVEGNSPSISYVAGTVFAIAFEGVGSDGYVTTININDDGTFPSADIDSFEFDTINGEYPSVVHIAGNVYAVAYDGNDMDGWLATVTIDSSGNVTPSTIDTLRFDVIMGTTPELFHVSGDVYAIAYRGSGSDGYVSTVSIDSAGNIADTVIDVLEYNTSDGYEPSVVHVSGDIYAIAFRGTDDDGFVTTVDINTDGTFSVANIDSLEFDTTNGEYPSAVHVAGDVYLVAYDGSGADGWVATISIDASGNVGASPIDTFRYDTVYGTTPDIINISGDVYAVAYRGSGSDGWLATLTVNSAGAITHSTIDTFEYNTKNGYEPDIVHVSGDIYAIAYRGTGSDGFLSTVEIDSAGNIANSVIDSLEYDTSNGYEPSMIHVSGDIYAVAYRGNGNDGWLATVEINTAGNITNSTIDTFEFDTSNGRFPDLIHIWGNVYAIAYRGSGDDGWLVTVEIGTSGNITNSTIDTFEFDNVQGYSPMIGHIAGDVYLITYGGSGTDGWAVTVDIDATGAIENSVIDSLEFDTNYGYTPVFLNVGTETYAVFYEGGSADGFVKTISLNDSGHFNQAVVNTFEYDTVQGYLPSLAHVSGDIYAVAYSGPGDDGWVSTLNIDSAGTITQSIVDSFEFDTTYGYEPDLLHVNGDIYTIAYSGPGDYGWVSTIDIDNTGNITNSVVDSLEFDNIMGTTPMISNISGEIYLIAYAGDSTDGWGATVNIDATGDISSSIIDSYEYNSSYGNTPFALNVGTGVWASFYEGVDADGFINTFYLSDAGIFNSAVINTYEFDTSNGVDPDLVHVDGDVYAIAYTGSGTDGWLGSINISTSGIITNAWIDTLEFDMNQAATPNIIHLAGDVFGVAYAGSVNDGFVSLIKIATDGSIPSSVEDIFEYDTDNGEMPSMLVQNGILEIAYNGPSDNGFIVSIGMDSSSAYPTTLPTISPVTSYTGTNFEQWTSFTETATKNGGEIYYQLSDDDGVTWYYWSGTAWVIAGATDYNTATEVDQYIYDFPVGSGTIMFKAFLESDGSQFVQLDNISLGCARLQMEVATASLDHNWTTVNMNNSYGSPIVVASHYDAVNTLPASVRVRNVTGTSFEARLENPSGSALLFDEVTYMVMEEGVWTLNGIKFEAHNHITSTTASNVGGWSGDTQTYKHTFTTAPIVLHQVQTENDPAWATTFVSNAGSSTSPPGTSNFWLALNTAEAAASHGSETLGWIAYEQTNAGNVGGTVYESVQTPDTVVGHDNACTTFTYSNTFASAPRTIVSQQEMDGNNGGWAVMCSNDLAQVGIYIDEDQVSDAERSHITETAAYLTFESDFSYSSGGGGGGGGSGYASHGVLTSSAYNTGATSAIQHIEWDESVVGCATCDINLEVRAAPDSGGVPGAWTDWYGENGASTVFVNPEGTLISTDLNDNQWIQYRATLTGDGSATPVLEEVRVNYR